MPRPKLTTNQDERRECSRLSCRAPVRVTIDPESLSDSFFLESTNLSPEGVFLHSDLLFPEGDWLDLEFVVPGQAQPVRGRGRVVRVHSTFDPPGPGMAVHIPPMSAEERGYSRQMNLIIQSAK